jgi:ABC-2 type transport system permease protein
MWMICKKEWLQFFSSLTGYLALLVYLLLNGLFLFVFPDTNLLDFGYASLAGYFSLAPWLLLFLIPTITMRSIADEFKSGSFELLKTLPISPTEIVVGKYLGCLMIVLTAILPTILYAFSLQALSVTGGIDIGATLGSYIGLVLLAAVFTAIGIAASSFTNNTVVAFIAAAFLCFLIFSGFEAFSKLSIFSNGMDYYIEMLGIKFHYKRISRGVIDSRDLIYFLGVIALFLFVTGKNILKR